MKKRFVLKISGELLWYRESLERLIDKVVELSKYVYFVLVPGGSVFADLVRELQSELGLSDFVAHWMAIKSMEVYGVYVASLHDALVSVSSLWEVSKVWSVKKVPVLLPYEVLKRHGGELPCSWSVTSDSLAVYIGYLLHVDSVLLSKVVDGIVDERGNLLHVIKVSEFSGKIDVVDEYVPKLVSELKVPTVVFNGLKPWLLNHLIRGEEGSYTILLP